MLKIAILDGKTLGTDNDFNIFNEYGEVEIYDTTKSSEVLDRIKDKDIIIANKILLNEDNLKEAHKLKLICISATGTNNVDLNYTNKRKIVVR